MQAGATCWQVPIHCERQLFRSANERSVPIPAIWLSPERSVYKTWFTELAACMKFSAVALSPS
jgi:hypothetical protein